MLTTVTAIGAIGGLLSGLLGVGGGVVLLPLLITVAGLSLKQASSITIAQVAASALLSFLAYHRRHMVHLRLAMYMGGAGALAGFAGGYGSRAVSSLALEWVFLLLVLVAIALLVIPPRELPAASGVLPPFARWQALGLGAAVGALAGLLGAGGGFLIVPLMIGALRLPTRLAIGSSPVVILLSGSFGLIGKLIAGEVQLDLAAALVLGASPCTYLGARLGQRLPARFLRMFLVVVLALIATRSLLHLVGERPVNPSTGTVLREQRSCGRSSDFS